MVGTARAKRSTPRVELAAEEARLGHVGDQQGAGEEDVELLARAPEVEVEVVDAGERQRVIDRVVIEHAAHDEELARVEALLDHPLALIVLHQVAQALLRVADHGDLRVRDLLARLLETGAVDLDVGEQGLALDDRRGVDDGEDLLGHEPQRQHVALGRPGRRVAGGVDGRVVEGLLVRDHLAFEADLDGAGAQAGVDLPVHPDGALVELAALVRAGRGEVDHPGLTAVHRFAAPQPVAVLLGEMDLQRQGRRLLGLDQGDLRQRLVAPLDAVDVEGLPRPVGPGLGIEEERPFERGLDGLRARRDLEAQRGRVERAVVLELAGLGVLEGLEAAQDLLDRDVALAGDGHLLLHALELGGRGAVQAEHGHAAGQGDFQQQRVPLHPAARRQHPLAAPDGEAHRPAQLRVAEPQRQLFGVEGHEDDHPQREVLAADERPGRLGTPGRQSGIVGEVPLELAGEQSEGREHGDEPRGFEARGPEQRQVDPLGRVPGGGGHHDAGIGLRLRQRQRVEHQGTARVELLDGLDGRRQPLLSGGLEGHGIHVGGHIFAVERLEGLRIGRQGPGGHLGVRLGAGHGHRGPLQEEGVFGRGEFTALRTPDDLEPGPARRLAGRFTRKVGRRAQLGLEDSGILGHRRGRTEHERYPGGGAAVAQSRRQPGIGHGISGEGDLPDHKQRASRFQAAGGLEDRRDVRGSGLRHRLSGRSLGIHRLRDRGGGVEAKPGARPARKLSGAQGERETEQGKVDKKIFDGAHGSKHNSGPPGGNSPGLPANPPLIPVPSPGPPPTRPGRRGPVRAVLP